MAQMEGKCASHDDCLERIYGRVEAFERKLDNNMALTNTLIGDMKQIMQKNTWEIDRLKEQLDNKGVDWRAFFIDLLRDVVRWGFFAGGAAAWWALRNGYNGQ